MYSTEKQLNQKRHELRECNSLIDSLIHKRKGLEFEIEALELEQEVTTHDLREIDRANEEKQ